MEELAAYIWLHYVDPYVPDWLKLIVVIYFSTSWLASQFCAKTSTPTANTIWGRIYGYIEWYGGIYGKAKDLGIPVPANPTIEDVKTDVEKLASDIEKGK